MQYILSCVRTKYMLQYKKRRYDIMPEMTVERAVDNAIASAEMEGFTFTEEQRALIIKLVKKEITLDDALAELNAKYTEK